MQPTQAVIGMDLGGTFTKIGIVDVDGNMLALEHFPTLADQPFDVFLHELHAVFADMKENISPDVELLSAGVGAPDTNCFTGVMENPPNFKWGEVVPLAKGLSNVLKLPVLVNNDANVAALGEMQFGGAKGMKHFSVITLGTGVGSGFVVDGKLHIGNDGMAGEIGHTIAIRNGRLCKCGLKGCLEQYASVTGIRKSVQFLLEGKDVPSVLRKFDFEDLTGKAINDAALAGDAIALEAFEFTGEMLGYKLAEMVAYFNPEAIFLTGGLAKAGDFILQPTLKHLEANLLHIFHGRVKLLISDLVDKEGAVLGAAALAWQKHHHSS